MRDLNRYVIKKFAGDWNDIGLELGLQYDTLKIVGQNTPNKVEDHLKDVLDKWLKLNPKATWRMLEVALTNVRRQQLGLDPLDDTYGEISLAVMLYFICTYFSIIRCQL